MINLIKSSFYNEQYTKDKLCEFIQSSEKFSIGAYCYKFEELFAKRQGTKYCSFFNSGSSANLALIQSLINMGKLKKGDKIGFSAITWATNVMPLLQLGLQPIPIDVEKDTLNISLDTVTNTFENHSDLKSIFITNLLGFCDNIDEIQKFCDEKEILFLEDNCESMGTVYKQKKLGNYSFGSTFSTFIGHHMSTIEGGMVCTDDKDLYDMLNMVRSHGWDRNLQEDNQKKLRTKYNIDDFYAKYSFYNLAYNIRPNEITGFLGCEQMNYIDEIVKIRSQNFKNFIEIVNKNSDFIPVKYKHIDLVSNFAVPIICKTKEILNKYIDLFNSKGIEIRPIVGGNMIKQPFWKDAYSNEFNNSCPNADFIHDNGFYFGNSPEYNDEELQIIYDALK